MSLRGFERTEEEILRAKAESLGRAGERLAKSLVAYRRLKAAMPVEPDASAETSLAEAWDAVMRARENLIVLREANGMRRHDSVDTAYDIPLRARSPKRG